MVNLAEPGMATKVEEVLQEIFRTTVALKGSVSGEHGIGIAKSPYIGMELDAPTLKAMRAIKQGACAKTPALCQSAQLDGNIECLTMHSEPWTVFPLFSGDVKLPIRDTSNATCHGSIPREKDRPGPNGRKAHPGG